MEANYPSWIDTPYLKKILHDCEHEDSVEITNRIVKPAVPKGDNFLSDMYRVTVEFLSVNNDGQTVQRERSVILKIAPVGDDREKPVEDAELFGIELSMMLHTLPRMNRILSGIGLPSLSPRCLYTQSASPVHLVLEDLTSRGFRMASRRDGLDLDHCLLAVQNLGRFHAASVALKEKNPDVVTKYTKGFYHTKQSQVLQDIYKQGVKAFATETTKWEELPSRIPEKLLQLSDVVFEKGCQAAAFRTDDFNVLNHGDFWVNNMLFRYDESQKPIDQILVDFQLCRYGSPALDLLFFIATSPSDDVRLQHRETIFRAYHDSLTSTMMTLNCKTDAPSFDDLQAALKSRMFYEAVATFVELPVMLLDKSQVVDLGEIIGQEDGHHNLGHQGKEYRKIMTRLLPLYDNLALLDV
ncbi:uncharacterized protein LOC125502073 [Athalia rosae]|uniref:uncharacterized protein LOC125502073 n=1 Tax=Athalia rosae TaxID=37344 RepID=UPI002033E49B|nr:uncharacterized protein LOC125502073 [Athalia rosae]XP_048515639.1 uncharacterized protein LOC125502073 [Athalia rosae]XP_048515646.1 uncharacterized protein LOC125502073 [Athalia rosae]XP_048515653.1 uncharacterized protein LOC125502073 [Athalia rosae]